MSGKVRNVDFSKTQLEKALKRKGKSKNDLYRYLVGKGVISERQIKKNVANESIALPVLEECAKYLECSPDYLRNMDTFADYFETEEELQQHISFLKEYGGNPDEFGREIGTYEEYKENQAFEQAFEHFNKFMNYLLPYFRFKADKYGDGNIQEYSLLDYAQQQADLDYLVNKPYQELILKIEPAPHKNVSDEIEVDFSGEFDYYLDKLLPASLREGFEHRQPFLDKFKTMTPEEILLFNGHSLEEEK